MSESSFAAAQQRILQRRTERRNEAALQRAATEQAVRDSPIGQLPRPLNRAAPHLTSFWNILTRCEGTRPAFRVGQVDAELLDDELLSLLKGQVGEGLKYFGAHLQDEWSQEIILALRAVLFKLSIWDNDASYGASLQNLRYADARSNLATQTRPSRVQKGMYGFLTVFGRYGWDRWETWLADQEGGYTTPSENVERLSRFTLWLSATHSIAAFTSFLVFLVNGRYRTLTDRLLRLRLVSPSNQIGREVSFEYLNRQLVWHAFTEFLLFLLPLVGISRWRRWLSRVWEKAKNMVRSQTEEEDDAEKPKDGPLSFLPERTCAICYQDRNPGSATEAEILGANTGAGGVVGSAATDIVNPYETIPCGCIYCFVCIATKIEGEEGNGWSCLRCGQTVYRCKPWNGDVLEDRKSEKNGKSVGFSDDQASDASTPTTSLPEKDMDSSQWTEADAG